jgi:uncharacterized protein (TIGR03435 family)
MRRLPDSDFAVLGVNGSDCRPSPPSGEPRPDNPPQPGGPSVFALLEQLGLKLESAKVSAEVLAIDSVDKPSEN